jgi:hypothetical protein
VLVLLLLLRCRCTRTLGKVQANSIESILAEQEYRLHAFAAPASAKDTRWVGLRIILQNIMLCRINFCTTHPRLLLVMVMMVVVMVLGTECWPPRYICIKSPPVTRSVCVADLWVKRNSDPCLLLLLLLLVLPILLLSDLLGLGRLTATQARILGTSLQAHTAAAAGRAAAAAAAMAAAAAGTARRSLCAQLGQQQAAGRSSSSWQMQVIVMLCCWVITH